MCKKDIILKAESDGKIGKIIMDINMDYNKNFKKILYMFNLLLTKKNINNVEIKYDLEDYEPCIIKLNTRSLYMNFYNIEIDNQKNLEYKTRLEFRFKRLKNYSLEQYLDKLIKLLKDIDNNISYIEEVMTNKLIERYEKDLKKDKVINLTDFTRQYKDFIFNTNILKCLHKKFCNGKYEYWIKNFRKKYKIDLISYSEINNFKKDCIRAIKQYKRSI